MAVNPDRELMDAWVARRDAEAFNEITRRYAGMVFAVCRRILGDAAEAEDAAQESFETLARTSRGPQSHLGAWLHRVATNRALTRRRAERRRRDLETRYAGARAETFEPAWDDLSPHVDAAIAELPERFRVPLVAHYLEGKTHVEIARSLGISRQTAAYRTERGVQLVREALRKQGLTVGVAALAALMGANLAEASSVPATLTASLGQLAIAAPPAAAAGVGAGLLTKAVMSVVGAIALGTGAFLLMPGRAPEPVRASAQESTVPSVPVKTLEPAAPEPVPVVVEETAAPAETAQAPEGDTIRGWVVDSGGRGLPDAEVMALLLSAESREPVETRAGEDGSFELRLAPQAWLLIASHDGYGDAHAVARLDAAPVSEMRLVLSRGGALEGVVTRDGQPFAGCTLMPIALRPGRGDRRHEAASAVDGTFRIGDLASGEYLLSATEPPVTGRERREIHQRAEVQEGLTTRVQVDFAAGASLEGSIRFAGKSSSRRVSLTVRGDVNTEEFHAKTNEAGFYRFDAIPAGHVILRAELGDSYWPIRQFEVGESEAARRDIDFPEPAGALACRFVSPDGDVEAKYVALLVGDDHVLTGSAEEALAETAAYKVTEGEPGPDGTFRAGRVEPGTYTVLALALPEWAKSRVALEGAGLMRPQTMVVEVGESGETVVDFPLAAEPEW